MIKIAHFLNGAWRISMPRMQRRMQIPFIYVYKSGTEQSELIPFISDNAVE